MQRWMMTLLVLVGALGVVAPAQASAASVSGTVTVPQGLSAEDMCVVAMRLNDFGEVDEQVETAVSGGQYTLSGLDPGYWMVSFSSQAGLGCGDSGLPTKRVFVFLDDGESATENVAIPRGGTISGTVSITGGYSPRNLCVLYDPDDPSAPPATTTVADNGSYALANLLPSSGSLWVYSDIGLCDEAATQIISSERNVSVFSEVTTTANITVDVGGSISGVITPPDGMDADWACVYAYPAGSVPSYLGEGFYRRTTSYSADGLSAGQARYELTDLAPGTYDVIVDSCSDDDARFARVAQAGVTVAPGAAVGNVNFTTPRAGSLAGSFGFGSSTEVIACVEAQSLSNPLLRHTTMMTRSYERPDAQVRYGLQGLQPGTYVVRVGVGDAGCLQDSITPAATIHASFTVVADVMSDAGTYTLGQGAPSAPAIAPVAPPAKKPTVKDPCAGKKTAALAVCRAKVTQDAALAACAKRPVATRNACQVTARAAFALTQATERAKGTLVTNLAACSKRPAKSRAACRATATKTYRRTIGLARATESLQVGTAQCQARPRGEQKACLAAVKKAHARAIKRARA